MRAIFNLFSFFDAPCIVSAKDQFLFILTGQKRITCRSKNVVFNPLPWQQGSQWITKHLMTGQ